MLSIMALKLKSSGCRRGVDVPLRNGYSLACIRCVNMKENLASWLIEKFVPQQLVVEV